MNILWQHPNPEWIPVSHLGRYRYESIESVMAKWDWDKLIWGKVRRLVFNLQKRIYKATKSGRYSKARNLMYLLQNSYYATLLAVRTVTTENKGKRTAGVDRVKANTPKRKMALVKDVLDTIQRGWDKYRPMPAKRIYIPKANGKLRPLGIPTIKDRAMQAVTKIALEPFYEAKFESCSYGFRPAMGCHDAIEKIAAALLKKQKWVLDADIKGCFDNIDHKFLAVQIDTHWRPIVKRWLKAGYMEKSDYNQTNMGTPQGGTISPLLANIALDQMETNLIEHLRGIKGWKKKIGTTTVSIVVGGKKAKRPQKENEKSQKEPKKANNKGTKESQDKPKKVYEGAEKSYKARKHLHIDLVRYADDFVVLHEDKEVIEESKRFIGKWLEVRGLTLSEEKTKIVHSTDGFDFLGHHIRHYENRVKGTYKLKLLNGTPTEQRRAKATHVLRVEPTKEKVKLHYREISDTIWKLKAATPVQLIAILQPKISGWANYYKTVHSSRAFGKLDMLLWRRLYQWACRRHPNKGKRWVANKYFATVNGRKWTFAQIVGKGKDRKIVKYLKGYSKHKERTGSYAKVGYDRSYYDGDTAYWAERLSKGYGNITPSKAKMLKRQDGICPVCKCRFGNEDLPEAHHIHPRHLGGEDTYLNLVLVHLHCHDKIHRENKGIKGKKVSQTSPELQGVLNNGMAPAFQANGMKTPTLTDTVFRVGEGAGIITPALDEKKPNADTSTVLRTGKCAGIITPAPDDNKET